MSIKGSFVLIEVDALGNVRTDAVGFRGKACDVATKEIEIALGGEMRKDKKPEYNLPPMQSSVNINL